MQGAAQTFVNLGNIYQHLGDFEQATGSLKKGLAYFDSHGDQHGLANALNDLGIVYWQQQNLEQAEKHFEESLRIKEALHRSYRNRTHTFKPWRSLPSSAKGGSQSAIMLQQRLPSVMMLAT